MFISSVNPLKILVDKQYLTNFCEEGLEEAYLIAVKAVSGKALSFTVHLESGAVFSSLPIIALRHPEIQNFTHIVPETHPIHQPFTCLEGPIQILTYDGVYDYKVACRLQNSVIDCRYLFTIEYSGDGVASDPEQFKTHNIIYSIETGALYAMPNNMCLFYDKHFTNVKNPLDISQWPRYNRNVKVYRAGS